MCEDCKKHPKESKCWPGDKDYLDGATEILLPSERFLKAYWDADILDDDEDPRDTIIEANEAFKVRFRVELRGRLWRCVCADWCFDLGFTAIGDGPDSDLSDVVPADVKSQLKWCGWKGCDTLCIERLITVPANTIPVEMCGSLYQVGAKFELRCCGDCDSDDDDERGPLAVAGHESQGEYMVV